MQQVWCLSRQSVYSTTELVRAVSYRRYVCLLRLCLMSRLALVEIHTCSQSRELSSPLFAKPCGIVVPREWPVLVKGAKDKRLATVDIARPRLHHRIGTLLLLRHSRQSDREHIIATRKPGGLQDLTSLWRVFFQIWFPRPRPLLLPVHRKVVFAKNIQRAELLVSGCSMSLARYGVEYHCKGVFVFHSIVKHTAKHSKAPFIRFTTPLRLDIE